MNHPRRKEGRRAAKKKKSFAPPINPTKKNITAQFALKAQNPAVLRDPQPRIYRQRSLFFFIFFGAPVKKVAAGRSSSSESSDGAKPTLVIKVAATAKRLASHEIHTSRVIGVSETNNTVVPFLKGITRFTSRSQGCCIAN